MIPEAYMVRHVFNGTVNKYITLDRGRAETYAAEHNGTLHFLIEQPEEVSERVQDVAIQKEN